MYLGTLSQETFAKPSPILIQQRHYEDERGSLYVSYNRAEFKSHGINSDFFQDIIASNIKKFTVRGLHFQLPPYTQEKLISVHKGEIFDVMVDLRVGSPSYGKCASVILSAENKKSVYIPAGFAHGYMTLKDHTDVIYKLSTDYAPDHERAIAFNDPDLNISWPIPNKDQLILSEQDRNLPLFKDMGPIFEYPLK
jgi:dTDP-4-dehydrorhamnose 3,5-epimerase